MSRQKLQPFIPVPGHCPPFFFHFVNSIAFSVILKQLLPLLSLVRCMDRMGSQNVTAWTFHFLWLHIRSCSSAERPSQSWFGHSFAVWWSVIQMMMATNNLHCSDRNICTYIYIYVYVWWRNTSICWLMYRGTDGSWEEDTISKWRRQYPGKEECLHYRERNAFSCIDSTKKEKKRKEEKIVLSSCITATVYAFLPWIFWSEMGHCTTMWTLRAFCIWETNK